MMALQETNEKRLMLIDNYFFLFIRHEKTSTKNEKEKLIIRKEKKFLMQNEMKEKRKFLSMIIEKNIK